MKTQAPTALVVSLSFVGVLLVAEARVHNGIGSNDSTQVRKPTSVTVTTPQQIVESLDELHRKCMQAGDRLQRDAVAMVPGRTWTWGLDSEKSREHIDDLRQDLQAFRDSEVAFEGGLSPEQKSKLSSQFKSIDELFHHIKRDAESLDTELHKGYPTRWHVAADVSDMQKEINRWRKLHHEIATDVGIDM